MRQKTFILASSLLLGSTLLFAEKPEAAMTAAQAEVSAAQAEATRVIVSRSLTAIPLSRSAGAARVLPFPDANGQLIPMGKPVLGFQILPFPDSRGNLIPILKDGPAILPFPDAAGGFIQIEKPQRIEPISLSQ